MTTNTPTRNQLHDLVDALPGSEIPAAAPGLAELADPFLRALAQAATRQPEELTPAEAADVVAGRIVSGAEARRHLRGR